MWSNQRVYDLAYHTAEKIRLSPFNSISDVEQPLLTVRNEYEAERATLQQENARLAAELDRREAGATYWNKRFGETWSECRELKTANERLAEDKEFWRKVAVKKEQQLTMVASAAQDNANDVTSAGNLIESLKAQLAAVRAEARWEPVEDGEYSYRAHDDRTLVVAGPSIRRMYEGKELAIITLLNDWAICRLVPGQDTPAQEGSE